MPIPSCFKTDSYTICTFNNFNHEVSTLSSIGGSHDTVGAMLQGKPQDIPVKLCLSETGITSGMKTIQELLPCQKV